MNFHMDVHIYTHINKLNVSIIVHMNTHKKVHQYAQGPGQEKVDKIFLFFSEKLVRTDKSKN